MNKSTRAVAGVLLTLIVAAASEAQASPLSFVGTFNYANTIDGQVICGGVSSTQPGYSPDCWRAFSSATGIGDPNSPPSDRGGRFDGVGTFAFTADSVTNAITSSEMRIGNWTASLDQALRLGFDVRTAACSPPNNSSFGLGSLLLCNWSDGLTDDLPPITIQYLHSQPLGSFFCNVSGLGAPCGRVSGAVWALPVYNTTLTPVSEPGTLALVAGALAVVVARRTHLQRKSRLS